MKNLGLREFKIHYFDHVINKGRIQTLFARDVEQASGKWADMRLVSQETLSIVEHKLPAWLR
jgi:hypothetical protein